MSDALDRVAKLPPQAFTYEVRPIASPPAGADFSITVNDGGVWRVVSLVATLTTSAVVANRDPHLRIDDQTTASMLYPVGVVQAASLAVTYNWLLGYPVLLTSAEQALVAVPLVDHVLHQGWRIRPVTNNIDGGDQWSAISITIEKIWTPPHTLQGEFVREMDREETTYEALRAGGFIQ
jgi:hypothetical protein